MVLLASDGSYSTGAGNLNRIDLFHNEFLTEKEGDTYWWWQHLGSNFGTSSICLDDRLQMRSTRCTHLFVVQQRLCVSTEYFLFRQTSFGGKLAKLPPNLVEFDCCYTLLSGGLSDSIFAGLDHLNYLVLDGNFFNGTVPRVLGQLPELTFLYLTDSFVTGDLSYLAQDGGMAKLYEHWLDFNPLLIGTIPTELGRITTLGTLSLTENGLMGPIPTELAKLSVIRQLWLSGNDLTGTTPTEFGKLRGLRTIQVESNSLTGSMPSEVCANYVQ